MQTVTAKITPKLIDELDVLIKEGWYANRSEAIRAAIRELIDKRKYMKLRTAIEEDIEWGLHGE